MRYMWCFACAFLALNLANAETLEQQSIGYTRILDGDRELHSPALDTLSFAGVSDTRVFDRVEKLLLQDANAASYSREDKNRVARYIRALGFSGQPKYLPTIQRYANDKVYERYVKAALADLPNYQRWNPIISDRGNFDSNLSDDVNRVANMLKSNDMELKKIGAKRVYFANKDEVLLEILAKDLRANYRTISNEESFVDTVAWMVKALGSAKSETYRPLLREVLSGAQNNKIRDYAKRALGQY